MPRKQMDLYYPEIKLAITPSTTIKVIIPYTIILPIRFTSLTKKIFGKIDELDSLFYHA